MATYPTAIPDLVSLIVQGMPIENLIQVADELHAALQTLGTNPQGGAGTVANRFVQGDLPSAIQLLSSAATQILPNARVIQINTGTAVTLTAQPTIAPGTDGQLLTILNVGSQAVTFQNGAGFQFIIQASTLQLNPAIVYPVAISFVFSTMIGGYWCQLGRL